jgi:hypothetical protein
MTLRLPVADASTVDDVSDPAALSKLDQWHPGSA